MSTPRTSSGVTGTDRYSSEHTDDSAPSPEAARIERDIERTRGELGDTAQALANKADVSGRLKERAQATTDTARAEVEEVRDQAQAAAHRVTDQVRESARTVADTARTVTDRTMDQLPPPARDRVARMATTVKEQPVPTAMVVMAVVMVLRWLMRRRTR